MTTEEASAARNEAPEREYSRRLAEREAAVAQWMRRHVAIGNAKVGLAGLAILIGLLAFGMGQLSAWWLLAPMALFLPLARRHDRVIAALDRSRRGAEFYERGLTRLGDSWSGGGPSGRRFLTRDHPYARDLDLFGLGSLFQRLCLARTEAGEECLAEWLCAPADAATIRERQIGVDELRPRLDLREDLSVLGEQVKAELNPRTMLDWAGAPGLANLPRIRIAAALLCTANVLTIAAGVAGYGYWMAAGSLIVGRLVILRYRKDLRRIIVDVERPARSLGLFAQLMARLESESFDAPLLSRVAVRMALASKPSARVARMQRLCELLEFRRSDIFAIIDAVIHFTFQVALALEAWRVVDGAELPEWLAGMGEMEAMLSVAGYAYERPSDPFPEIAEGDACIDGEALGHPLLPATTMVRNDARLDAAQRLLVVSGSNMSGKSTYLRTLGVNVVLALAGAPVCARRLRISVWQVGTSIQTIDSLQEGISRFYAELLRLRRIKKLTAGPRPVLFLLDEILHGTNSHDRLIGAEAVVRALVAGGASGLVTTHDLALAQIATDESLHAANVHFADEIVDGKMTFDYRLRPGVVQRSNAIALMRIVGLDV